MIDDNQLDTIINEIKEETTAPVVPQPVVVEEQLPPMETISSNTINDKPAFTGRNGEFNAWDDFDILPPKELDITGLTRNTKTFAVASRETIPESALTRLKQMLPLLADGKYINNHSGSTFDKAEAVLLNGYFDKDIYVPFKTKEMSFKPKLDKPTELAYAVAKATNKNMADLSRGLRAVISNKYHIMYGEDLKHPVEFLIVYSSDKATTLKTHDYKVVKGMYDWFKHAGNMDIVVINLALEDSVEILKKNIELNHPKPVAPVSEPQPAV